MSNETGLTDKERKILASLAQKASADDPVLAAALRGSGVRRWELPTLPPILRHWASGLVATVLGLCLAVLSLSNSLVIGYVGLLVMFAGAGVVVADQARIRGARRQIAAGGEVGDRSEV